MLLAAAARASGASIFVAPGGDDARSGGDGASAVRTLGRAVEILRRTDRTSGAEVILADGVYRLEAALVLDAGVSGQRGHPVVFRAAPGAHPVISGGVRVDGWRQTDPARHRWEAPLPVVLQEADFRQVYVDGVRAVRARGRPPVLLAPQAGGYLAADDRIAHWRHPDEVEMVYGGGESPWTAAAGAARESRVRVTKVLGRAITMAESAELPDQPAYLENAAELLGRPGEFHADRAAGVIEYTARTGEELVQGMEVPLLGSLVVVAGAADRPAHDITFSGLQFAYAAGGRRGAAAATSSLRASFAHRVRWENSLLTHLGGTGLAWERGCQDCAVDGCVFTDISGGGVRIGTPGGAAAAEAEAEGVRDDAVVNTVVTDVATEFHGEPAIAAFDTQRLRIAHNQIDHVPYVGIAIGRSADGPAAGWGDTVVADNLVFDHMLLLGDGGGIVIQGAGGPDSVHGTKVVGNIVRDQWGSGHGLATRPDARFVTLSGNIVFHASFDSWGVAGAGGAGVVATDNYWEQAELGAAGEGAAGDRNQLISGVEQAPRALQTAAGLEPEFRQRERRRRRPEVASAPPEGTTAWAGDRFALISWHLPGFEGGGPIRAFTVRASTGQAITISAAHFRSEGYARLDGLPNGTACTFSVETLNAFGRSAPSLPSAPVTCGPRPVKPPGPPRDLSVRREGGVAAIRFARPAIDGGGPLVSYVLTIDPGKRRIVFSGWKELMLGPADHTVEVVDGLGSGTPFQFLLAAANPAGEGAPAQTEK